MRNRLQLQLILLLLLVTLCRGQTMKREITYNVLGEGQKILGKIGGGFTMKSSQECAGRCLANEKCVGYKNQHNATGPINCTLIHCTNTDHQTFESDENGETYTKVPKREPGELWTQPVCWSGPEAVLYKNFDHADGLVFMEWWTQMNFVPLVPGRVNNALTLDRINNQWVDLGIHTEVCMTDPITCAAGGAISLWVNIIDYGGIITSRAHKSSGSVIFCYSNTSRFGVSLLDERFYVSHARPSGWTHIVLNYIGPNDGEGTRIYYDGQEVASDTTKDTVYRLPGEGRIVVGRLFTDIHRIYGSLQVDELIFFNRSLIPGEISVLAN